MQAQLQKLEFARDELLKAAKMGFKAQLHAILPEIFEQSA